MAGFFLNSDFLPWFFYLSFTNLYRLVPHFHVWIYFNVFYKFCSGKNIIYVYVYMCMYTHTDVCVCRTLHRYDFISLISYLFISQIFECLLFAY